MPRPPRPSATHTLSAPAGKATSPRQLRVGEEVRHVLTQIFARDSLRDPALAGVPVMVTEVRMSHDLSHATAFVAKLGGEDTPEAQKALVKACRRASPFLRGQMARELRLQFVPELGFQADTSFGEAARIGELFNRPEVLRDLLPKEDDPDAADDDAGDDLGEGDEADAAK